MKRVTLNANIYSVLLVSMSERLICFPPMNRRGTLNDRGLAKS